MPGGAAALWPWANTGLPSSEGAWAEGGRGLMTRLSALKPSASAAPTSESRLITLLMVC